MNTHHFWEFQERHWRWLGWQINNNLLISASVSCQHRRLKRPHLLKVLTRLCFPQQQKCILGTQPNRAAARIRMISLTWWNHTSVRMQVMCKPMNWLGCHHMARELWAHFMIILSTCWAHFSFHAGHIFEMPLLRGYLYLRYNIILWWHNVNVPSHAYSLRYTSA